MLSIILKWPFPFVPQPGIFRFQPKEVFDVCNFLVDAEPEHLWLEKLVFWTTPPKLSCRHGQMEMLVHVLAKQLLGWRLVEDRLSLVVVSLPWVQLPVVDECLLFPLCFLILLVDLSPVGCQPCLELVVGDVLEVFLVNLLVHAKNLLSSQVVLAMQPSIRL